MTAKVPTAGAAVRPGRPGEGHVPEPAPIRVLHVLWTSQFGGITMSVRDLINGVDADRFDISVCMLADGDLDLATLLVRPARLDALHVASAWDLAGAWRFCRLLRTTACDVVHSHTPSILATLALAVCRPRTPRIFHEHGAVLLRRASWRTRLSYRCLARRYDAFVAVSASVVEDMKAAAIDGRRIRVIENAVDPGAADPADGRRDARAKLGLSGEGLLVGAACRLAPEKDLGLFVRVAQRVHAARPDVRFAIAGAGPLAHELRQLAQECGLGDALVFLGPQTDMPAVWRALDVFLFTSAMESFGRALLEAQAYMTPVVAPRQVAGGAAELIAASPGVLAVGTREPEDLAQAVLRLLASEQLRDDLGRAGREWVAQRSGVGEWAREIESLYLRLLGRQR